MAVQCEHCNSAIRGKDDNVLKCRDCGLAFHKKCVKEAKLMDASNLCVQCQAVDKEAEDLKIKVDMSSATPQEVLVKVNEKLELLCNIQKTLRDLAKSVEFYAEQYQELKDHKEKMEKKVKALEDKNVNLEKSNKALEERINYLEIKEKEKNVEIYGLDWKEEEDIGKTVRKFAEKLSLNPASVVAISKKRVSREKSSEKARPRPVIVSLATRAARDEWMAKKKSRLTNNEIYNNGDSRPIYINEDVTRFIKQLFWTTKSELKSAFKYIWIQEGKILLRKEDPCYPNSGRPS
ncbi:phorbol esters/diacylglycerol binding domain (C1 domain) domain-containing protein [Phthorimaea operculella]|nr:phorbol esters/diacylglycerol binding domain (C1 domain) domain-containing protein [Phthorimaea operculella]